MAKEEKEVAPQDIAGFRLGLIPLQTAEPTVGGRTDLISVIVFGIGGQIVAVDVDATEGVVDCPDIAPLPYPPRGVVGITSVRGRITVAVDLSFGLGSERTRRRLILLRGEAQLGLLADRVESVIALEPEKVCKATAEDTAPDRDSRSPDFCDCVWLASAYFKYDGVRIPIIDVGRLVHL